MHHDSVDELTVLLRSFAAERDWARYHTPRSLMLALTGEIGELAELMQFRTDGEIEARMATADGRGELADELADVFIYTVRLADVLGVDLIRAANEKVQDNARRYPADEVRGSAEKRP